MIHFYTTVLTFHYRQVGFPPNSAEWSSLFSCSMECLAFSHSVYLMLPKSVYIVLKKLVFFIPVEVISYFHFWIFLSSWNQVGINTENGFHHPRQLYQCHFIMNIQTTVHYFWPKNPPVIIVIVIAIPVRYTFRPINSITQQNPPTVSEFSANFFLLADMLYAVSLHPVFCTLLHILYFMKSMVLSQLHFFYGPKLRIPQSSSWKHILPTAGFCKHIITGILKVSYNARLHL